MNEKMRNEPWLNDKKAPIWWKSECPKYGEPCSCKEECMYLRQKSLRKLDVIVAEKVMGHKIVPNNGKDRPDEWAKEKYFIKVDFGISLIPHYSTDIAAAWEVVEKMLERGGCEIGCYGSKSGGKWFEVNVITMNGEVTVTAHTAPEAICKAALLAVMEGEKDDRTTNA